MKNQNARRIIKNIFISILISGAFLFFGISFVSASCSIPSGCTQSGNDLVCNLTENADGITIDNFGSKNGQNFTSSPLNPYTYKNSAGSGDMLFKFNTYDLNASGVIVSLFFNETWVNNDSYYPGNPTKDILQVGIIDGSWSKNTVSWANHPALGNIYSEVTIDQSQAASQCSTVYGACSSGAGTYIDFDITDIYKEWLSGSENNGFYIQSKYGDYANPTGFAAASGNCFNGRNPKVKFVNFCSNPTSALSVSCSASPNPVNASQTVTFAPTVSGGSGAYTYLWSGACTGTGVNCSNTFSNSGTQTATLTVTSGTSTASASCSTNINQNINNHSYTQCYNNNVYWYNSAGVVQELYQTCITNNNNLGNYCVGNSVYNQGYSNGGCVNGACYNLDSMGILRYQSNMFIWQSNLPVILYSNPNLYLYSDTSSLVLFSLLQNLLQQRCLLAGLVECQAGFIQVLQR